MIAPVSLSTNSQSRSSDARNLQIGVRERDYLPREQQISSTMGDLLAQYGLGEEAGGEVAEVSATFCAPQFCAPQICLPADRAPAMAIPVQVG